MKNKVKVSLSLKIAILVGLSFMLMFEFLIGYFKDKNIEDFKNYSKARLVENAKLIAANIDGDAHKKAIMMNDSSNIYYKKIQNILNKSKISLGIKEEIATIFLHNDTTSCYGVMSNVDTIARLGCAFRDTSLKGIFQSSFKKSMSISSDIYNDRNGTWISGFSPILDKNGKVVAVVELDLTLNEYQKKLEEYTNWITYFRIIGIIISILISIFLGIIIGKPLSNLSYNMSILAEQEKADEYKISLFQRILPDETTSLILSFNKMSNRLSNILQQLHKANTQLQELDKSKSVFLSLMAHELRTPLTGLGFIDLLSRHNSCTNEDKEIIENIKESYERMKEFSLSAENYIKALNYQVEKNSVTYLQNIIQSLIQNIKLTHNRNIVLKGISDEILIHFNEDKFEDVLTKIIENAVKFSDKNSDIRITIEKSDENFVILSVEDKGIGIRRENLDKIFEPYFVNDIDSHSKGTGVNLAICKAYINKYDGNITAYSNGINEGSKFILKLKIFEKINDEKYESKN